MGIPPCLPTIWRSWAAGWMGQGLKNCVLLQPPPHLTYVLEPLPMGTARWFLYVLVLVRVCTVQCTAGRTRQLLRQSDIVLRQKNCRLSSYR